MMPSRCHAHRARPVGQSLAAGTLMLLLIGLPVSAACAADGALTLRSADGQLQTTLGGNLTLGAALLSPDAHSPLDISGSETNHSGFFMRRAIVTLTGAIYGFDYAIVEDLSSTNDPADGTRDVWLGHQLGQGGMLMLGQHKPWRSLDELASGSTTPFSENDVVSANGILGGRYFTQGLYYRWMRRHVLAADDDLWLGASFYSNTKGDKGAGGGYGANGRIVYVPFLAARQWLHLGASYSYDQSPAYASGAAVTGYGAPNAGYRTWYGRQGKPVSVASFGAGAASSAVTLEGELAAAYGPLYLQGEYAGAQLRQTPLQADVRAYSVTVAVSLTGETRSYARDRASYGALRPTHRFGAVEAVLRYDDIFNEDLSTCALKAGATRCQIASLTAGINYYANDHVRFMLDYQLGRADAGAAGIDSPHTIDARAQATF